MPRDTDRLLREARTAGLSAAALAQRAGVHPQQLEGARSARLSASERWRLERALWEYKAEELLRQSNLSPCRWVSDRAPPRNRKEVLELGEHILSCPICQARRQLLQAELGPAPESPAAAAIAQFNTLFSWLPYDAPLHTRLVRGIGRGLVGALGLTALLVVLVPLELARTGGELGIPLGSLIIAYFQAGVLGAGVFYSLRPLHRELPGILFAGYLAVALVLFALTFSLLAGISDTGWTISGRLLISAAGAVLAGPLVGLLQWWHDEPRREEAAA